MKPVVIKLGGSLLQDGARLSQWLDAIAANGAGRIVIVPGGGHYADAVRARQVNEGLADADAHRQAIEAMRQTASDLLALSSGVLKPADSIAQVDSLLKTGGVPVAVPREAWLVAADIRASWDWTSDSLALWLGQGIRAEKLLLVKSVTPDRDSLTAAAARQGGLVDAAFPGLLETIPITVAWAGPGDSNNLADWLNKPMCRSYCTIQCSPA